MPPTNQPGAFPGRTFGYLSLGLMSVTAALVAAGWNYRAAGQNPVRPYIPRPSDVRPLSRTQPPALSPPAAGAKTVPPGVQTSPGTIPDDQKPKQAGLELEDPLVDEKTGITTGRDFTYREDDMVVTGAKAKYNKNTRELFCDGSLVLDDPKHHVTGDKAHVDNKKSAKWAKFDGNVIIVVKPKPADNPADDVNKEKNKGATIYCDHVDDYYKKEFVILTGHLIVKQQITKANGKTVERTLNAHHAEYDGKKDQLHLFAPVDVTDTDNQEAHFKKDVFVGTKEGQETLASKGPARIIINVGEDPDEAGPTPGDQTDKPAPVDPGTPKSADPASGPAKSTDPNPADKNPGDTKPPADKK